MTRREILAAPSASLLAAPARFSFVHFTDTHLQPELQAEQGTREAFAAINRLPHDFVLGGGDLVMDVFDQGPARARLLYDRYRAAAATLARPLYCVPGNHDVYGVNPASGVSLSDPLYGKKMYEDRIGPRYRAFTHRGWRFLLLDSIGLTPERAFEGRIDEEQLHWLRAELRAAGPATPIVAVTHIPLVTGFMSIAGARPSLLHVLTVANASEVIECFRGYRVKAVLQGHTHITERLEYQGVSYITGGAVCGNWWRGPHRGASEGFSLFTVDRGELKWQYRTYGWRAVESAPPPSFQ